ncbi:MAG: alpha/beta fold hydrolase, partial [Steroidobacteraceae bacterium]|nr:alpha/beta fold hydrolase [Steroidobacteraceae bacterium]
MQSAPDAQDVPGAQNIREGVLEIPGEIRLYFGAALNNVRVGWRLQGPVAAPVIAAFGGISADRRVLTGLPGESGWWQDVLGSAQALGAHAVRVLSFDWLGGSGATSGPAPGAEFPPVSTYDQAELLLRLLNHLGIKALHAIVGASYGGMVALAFAERYPERVARVGVVSASDRTHPMATAWRCVQRRIIRLAWRHGAADEGLELARALAMATYRSPEEFAARFAGSPRLDAAGHHVFPVEEYLLARGAEYARRHQAGSFLCLSESIDLHRVDAGRIFTPVLALA